MATGPVQMARTQIAENFLATGSDYLVMHDDDLGVTPLGPVGNPLDEWVKLMEENPTVGLIGAVYLREVPRIPTLIKNDPDVPLNRLQPVAGWEHKPFEMDGIGTGFIMVRRQAMLDLAADNDGPMFRFPLTVGAHGQVEQLGEDYDFCFRLGAHGWKVIADPRIPTVHHKGQGHLVYEWNDWNQRTMDPVKPMELDLGPGMRGARIIHIPTRNLDGTTFDLAAVDIAEVKKQRAMPVEEKAA